MTGVIALKEAGSLVQWHTRLDWLFRLVYWDDLFAASFFFLGWERRKMEAATGFGAAAFALVLVFGAELSLTKGLMTTVLRTGFFCMAFCAALRSFSDS